MSGSKRTQRLYRYVIDHDRGFAPNPFFGVCTLACCKPQIRKHAAKGDVIVGFGPKKYGLDGQMIYWMSVNEITDFQSYWGNPDFLMKRPQMGGSLCLCFGDNIYHRCPDSGDWIQEQSFHSDAGSLVGLGNLKRDTGTTDSVLVGHEYAYWGNKAQEIPNKFKSLVHRGRGFTYKVDSEALKLDFIEWLRSLPECGFRHDPADWSHDKKMKQLLINEAAF